MELHDWSSSEWLSVGGIILCLLISFFFSASETSLTASSRARLSALERAGDRRASRVKALLEAPERLIGTILIGNNLTNTAAATLTTAVMLSLFGERGLVYATAIVAIVVIVFAEILPKTLAINYPERVALFVSGIIGIAVKLLGPVTIACERFVRGVLYLFGVRLGEHANALSGAEELRSTVDHLHREGTVEKLDRDMVGGILDLKDLTVEDVMIHRTKMLTVDIEDPVDEIIRQVLAAPYTRLPFFRGSPENIVGILHGKDLLRALQAAGNDYAKLDLTSLLLPVWFVPDSTQLQDQLKAFLRRKMHFALVVDEYGEVQGLVTLEDIIEEIVGDIKDEHDVAVTGVRPQADGSVNVDGSIPIRDLNRAMDWNLPDDEATTIAGLVIHEARLIPETGQSFTFHGFRFVVMRRQRNRITALKIIPVGKA